MMLQERLIVWCISLDVDSDAVLNELQNSATTEQDSIK